MIKDMENNNNFTICCEDEKNNKKDVKSFFKFSPLIDPVKFMVGKYEKVEKNIIETLPKLNKNGCLDKVLDQNNSAYVDSFFSYLTSQLLHQKQINHGIDFYGTFTAIQTKYICNIFEDIEYLHDSKFFHKNKDKLFETDNIDFERFLESDTRKYKNKIKIDNSKIELEVDTLNDEMFEDVFKLTQENVEKHNKELDKEIWKSELTEAKSDKKFKKQNLHVHLVLQIQMMKKN